MLKQITVQNFACFPETQTLDFEPGHYFMIGENDSGKSSLFEIIRGCMGHSKSTCLTKPHDPAKPSIAICCFRDCKDNLKVKDATKVTQSSDSVRETEKTEGLGEIQLLSALIRPCFNKEENIYLKLVHVRRNGEENDEFEMAYLTANTSSGIDLVWKPVNHECCEDIRNSLIRKSLDCQKADPVCILQTIHEHLTLENILQTLHEHLTLEKLKVVNTEKAKLLLLKRYINKSTVVTFPLSGISPCQWTKSKRLAKNKGQSGEHYEEQEEIITWYLKPERRAEISDEEKRQEEEYFRLIANNSDFHFSYDNGKVTVTKPAHQDTYSSWRQTPEGIYGAKKLSVLLAVNQFQTVCLEEPGRGMHPQMVERIRDLVLRQVQNKVILITSHNPSFLSPSTLERVFLFRREPQYNCTTCTIRPLIATARTGQEKKNQDKTGRIITSGQSPLLFFASKVLLVEGDGDYIFANTLREVLLESKYLLQKYIETAVANPRDARKDVEPTDLATNISATGEAGKTPLETSSQSASTNTSAECQAETSTHVMETNLTSKSKVSSESLQEKNTMSGSERVSASIIGPETAVYDAETDRMKTFLCSLQIIAMIGEANKFHYKDFFGSRLDQKCLFLMDKDALTRNIPGNKPKDPSPEGFLKRFGILNDVDDKEMVNTFCEKVLKDVSILEEYQLFIWKRSIETAAADLAEKTPGLMEFCKDNNVLLRTHTKKAVGENEEKPRTKPKLLSDQKLTNENIRKVVKRLVEESVNEPSSEIHRLILFLVKQCEMFHK